MDQQQNIHNAICIKCDPRSNLLVVPHRRRRNTITQMNSQRAECFDAILPTDAVTDIVEVDESDGTSRDDLLPEPRQAPHRRADRPRDG